MRWLLRLAALGGLALLVSVAIPLVAVLRYHDPVLPPDARAIIVLGGDVGPGGPGVETAARVDRGVALWRAGAAPLLVFSGGLRDWAGKNHAAQMVARAVRAGVDPQAILLEPESRSTLQNAYLTRRVLGGDLAAPVILVTHRYHLPRGWASFRLAGFRHITLVAADGAQAQVTARDLALEALKWPFNVLRGGAAGLMTAFGVPPGNVNAILP